MLPVAPKKPRVRVRQPKVSKIYEPVSNSERAKILASTGAEVSAMAARMGIGVEDFRRTYRKELTTGHDYVYAWISEMLVRAALAGDRSAQMAWLRQFGGWLETTRKEITGKDGQPISIQSLDGPSLLAVFQALGKEGSARRGAGRAITQEVDFGSDARTLDAVPGPADEGAE
jgi:hypothetical protein